MIADRGSGSNEISNCKFGILSIIWLILFFSLFFFSYIEQTIEGKFLNFARKQRLNQKLKLKFPF